MGKCLRNNCPREGRKQGYCASHYKTAIARGEIRIRFPRRPAAQPPRHPHGDQARLASREAHSLGLYPYSVERNRCLQ